MTDPLDRAAAALRAAPVPPGPPPELRAATVAALHAQTPLARPSEPRRAVQRRLVMRIAGFATAAAVVAGVGLFALPGKNAAAAFSDVLTNVEKA